MFSSFFLAGFECATGYNVRREWFDQIAATGHDCCAEEDYRLLSRAGLRAAREGVRWSRVDQGKGRYDFSSLAPMIEAARRHNVELIYDLFHFGYPEGVDLFSSEFPERFADYCHAVARFVSAHSDGVCYFTPINEPSYFSWAAGEMGLFAPHTLGRGWELKVCLARAAIRGIDAIRAACPAARIVNVDPLCRVVAPAEREDLQREADEFNRGAVMQAWDMIAGRLLPELGGSLSHLDIVGVNYYWTNQWELGRACQPLNDWDDRRLALREMVRGVCARYAGAEILITETGHVGEMRAPWLRELATECEAMLEEGLPLRGACLYPVLGMPEWHDQRVWARMGLWDLEHDSFGALRRVPYEPMHDALREAQSRLEPVHARKNMRALAAYA
jgi:beta-glucosidase/6-phospho-beta-glucosidase/beta-galactosidase